MTQFPKMNPGQRAVVRARPLGKNNRIPESGRRSAIILACSSPRARNGLQQT